MLVTHNSRLKMQSSVLRVVWLRNKGKTLDNVLFSYLYTFLAALPGFVLFGTGSGQCCGSETIFFYRIPFASEFWILADLDPG
jgi:hypothetical protein